MKASARWHREWCATLAARLVTSLIVLGAGRTPADAQLGNVPWAMLSHDLHHTGKSAVVGPLTANLKWTQFLHIGFVKSSPMVGKDQMGNPTIYIAAAYNVLALDAATGATKWIHKLPANVRRNSAAIRPAPIPCQQICASGELKRA